MNFKLNIPRALREQVWLKYNGKKYEHKCYVRWCTNKIDVFNFQVGHNIPESKGGKTVLENLRPICSRCNQSMSNNYTIDEWDKLGDKPSCFNFLKLIKP
jgi:5-methylcytosine-specific restriction endonuclease McrA